LAVNNFVTTSNQWKSRYSARILSRIACDQ